MIIGGVIAGNELISQAKVRDLIKDIDNIKSSVNTFKIKYGFLPGDFPNASNVFACTAGSAPSGCDGNGNWILEYIGQPGTYGSEIYRFWQHLYLAGTLPNAYLGRGDIVNQFQTQYSTQTVITPRNIYAFGGGPSFNFLEIGQWLVSYGLPLSGAITPSDAYNFDSKIDDGVANKGKVFGADGISTGANLCSYPNGLYNGLPNYNLTGSQGPYCRMKVMIE